MLNRRHLRIKALQILYAFYQTENADYGKFEKELFTSIEKMYDLYIYFLLIFEELGDFANERIEERKLRIRPSEEDLNPNRKFVDNRIMAILRINNELKAKSEFRKIDWRSAEKNDLIKKMFLAVTESEIFEAYMTSEDNSFADDKNFLIELFKTEIANFGLLHDFLENETIYWQDDIDLVCSMVIKTIRGFNEGDDEYTDILSLYKDEEDEVRFVECLMRNIVDRDEENNVLIDKLTKNWDLERIAKMDTIILKMAITELCVFPSIPVKVSLNEYIEIAKFYSSPQSKVFINGVLDKSIIVLTKEGKIKKTGRGLLT